MAKEENNSSINEKEMKKSKVRQEEIMKQLEEQGISKQDAKILFEIASNIAVLDGTSLSDNICSSICKEYPDVFKNLYYNEKEKVQSFDERIKQISINGSTQENEEHIDYTKIYTDSIEYVINETIIPFVKNPESLDINNWSSNAFIKTIKNPNITPDEFINKIIKNIQDERLERITIFHKHKEMLNKIIENLYFNSDRISNAEEKFRQISLSVEKELTDKGIPEDILKQMRTSDDEQLAYFRYSKSKLEKEYETVSIEAQIKKLEEMYGENINNEEEPILLYRIGKVEEGKNIEARAKDMPIRPQDHISVGSNSKNYQSPYISTTNSQIVRETYFYTGLNTSKKNVRFNQEVDPIEINVTTIYKMLKERLNTLNNEDYQYGGEKELYEAMYERLKEENENSQALGIVKSHIENINQKEQYQRNEALPEEIYDGRKVDMSMDLKKLLAFEIQKRDEGIFKGKTEKEIIEIIKSGKGEDYIDKIINKIEQTYNYAPASAEVLFKGQIPAQAVKKRNLLAYDLSQGMVIEPKSKMTKFLDNNENCIEEILNSGKLTQEEADFVNKFYKERKEIADTQEAQMYLNGMRNTIVKKYFEILREKENEQGEQEDGIKVKKVSPILYMEKGIKKTAKATTNSKDYRIKSDEYVTIKKTLKLRTVYLSSIYTSTGENSLETIVHRKQHYAEEFGGFGVETKEPIAVEKINEKIFSPQEAAKSLKQTQAEYKKEKRTKSKQKEVSKGENLKNNNTKELDKEER